MSWDIHWPLMLVSKCSLVLMTLLFVEIYVDEVFLGDDFNSSFSKWDLIATTLALMISNLWLSKTMRQKITTPCNALIVSNTVMKTYTRRCVCPYLKKETCHVDIKGYLISHILTYDSLSIYLFLYTSISGPMMQYHISTQDLKLEILLLLPSNVNLQCQTASLLLNLVIYLCHLLPTLRKRDSIQTIQKI